MLAVWGLKNQQVQSENFPRFARMCADFAASAYIDILACRDETIRTFTVIRLNLNPPFKNPRSATENEGRTYFCLPVALHAQAVHVVDKVSTYSKKVYIVEQGYVHDSIYSTRAFRPPHAEPLH